MADDLVERLRTLAQYDKGTLAAEAAAEIARLRAFPTDAEVEEVANAIAASSVWGDRDTPSWFSQLARAASLAFVAARMDVAHGG